MGSGSTYQNGACCNARFYGTISYVNTYWGWPSGSNWGYYLSPYYDLLDFEYWYLFGGQYGGLVTFRYGAGYNSAIDIDLFAGSNGSYDDSIAAPDVSQYRVYAAMSSFYDSQGSGSAREHFEKKQYNSQPVASRQVNITIPIDRP